MVVISASAAAIVGTIKLLSKPTATVINFSSKLKELISMLRVLEPLLEKIAILNRQLNRPQSETDIFISLFNQGEQLVCKCYTIEEWDVINRWRYSKKLSDFQSLLRDVCRVLLITLEMSEATDGVPAPANCSCLEEMASRLGLLFLFCFRFINGGSLSGGYRVLWINSRTLNSDAGGSSGELRIHVYIIGCFQNL